LREIRGVLRFGKLSCRHDGRLNQGGRVWLGTRDRHTRWCVLVEKTVSDLLANRLLIILTTFDSQ
jgi:hypothetical protein